MKRMLLAGGSHSDIPLILAAKRLGFHVTTSGNRSQDLGHAHADAFEPVDYSDREALLGLARRLRVDALCACCNDFSALSCAYAAHELRLPGHDEPFVAEIVHHKDQWRTFCAANGIPSPRAIGCQNFEEAQSAVRQLRLPLLVKPVDLSGGKGIQRIDSAEGAVPAVHAAFAVSKAKRIVVEELITGSHHGFTAILRNMRVAFYFVDDEQRHLSPYLVSGASAPTSSTAKVVQSLINNSERIASLLGLVDGIFHVQYVEHDGEPVIVEICRRAPGDLYVELVRHCTGVPYAEWIVRGAAGLSIVEVHHAPVISCTTRHCLMAPCAGTFLGLEIDPAVGSRVVDRMIWAKPGDMVLDPHTHKLGIVFVRHHDVFQMRQETPRLQELLRARMQVSGAGRKN